MKHLTRTVMAFRTVGVPTDIMASSEWSISQSEACAIRGVLTTMSILEKSKSPMHHDATHKNLVRCKNAGKLGRLVDMVFPAWAGFQCYGAQGTLTGTPSSGEA